MKKYLLMGAVQGIGGWQLYCDARVAYLKECGYKVYILELSPVESNRIKLDGFKDTCIVALDEAVLTPNVYKKSQVIKIINDILDGISYASGDQVFVESTCVYQAYWGELIAYKTHGIHFSYLLHSHLEFVSKNEKRYFYFKYKQGLLGGMTNNTVADLLGDYAEIDMQRTNGMVAMGREPICDSDLYDSYVSKLRLRIGHECIVIGYFGTLNKPHFIKLCDLIVNYSIMNPDKKFCFLSIGSSSDGKAECKQMNMEKLVPNIFVENVPELYPVPKSLFSVMDVCIGSWGSADVAARAGARTIRLMDDVDVKPQGIIGITLLSSPHYNEQYEKKELNEWLDDFLFNHVYDDYKYYAPPMLDDYRKIHRKNDEIIQPFVKRKWGNKYYNTTIIKRNFLKQIPLKIIYVFCGITRGNKVLKIAQKLYLNIRRVSRISY